MGGEGIFPAEWVENIPTWLRIVMLVIAFPVVMVVAFLLFGYLSALLYSPLYWCGGCGGDGRKWRSRSEDGDAAASMWVVYLLGIGALGLVCWSAST